ncbi:hypothetical protein ACFFHJ_41705 [Planotetraspora thailandica]|nr:hypothetical protein [Planotetraspora thailandica]
MEAIVSGCGADVEQWTNAWRSLRVTIYAEANPRPSESLPG